MSLDPSPHAFLDALRSKALHVTPQRLAVLRAVSRCPHGSADSIAAAVREELGSVSTQTIYDALATFVARGLVRRLEPAGSPALYDPRAGDRHHHAICRVCGAVQDVDCDAGAPLCHAPSADYGYAIDEAEVVYWGFCPRCRATAGSPPDAIPVNAARPNPIEIGHPEPPSTKRTRPGAEPAREERRGAPACPVNDSTSIDPRLPRPLS